MNNIAQAIWVEGLKARRSKMPLITALGFSAIALAGGFFMLIIKDPEMARRVGLISVKAQITLGVADWPNYIRFLEMATGAGGIVLFGLITIWIFGREYSDRTVKDLLALPTPRSAVVLSKFGITAAWSAALVVILCLAGLAVGAVVRLAPAAPEFFWQSGLRLVVAAGLTIALVPVTAFFASAGHGYLPAIGIMILVMALAQIASVIGYGEYFPWAIPGLYAQGTEIGPLSYLIVLLTGVLGAVATVVWWKYADQAV